jgi:hypothetical protein
LDGFQAQSCGGRSFTSEYDIAMIPKCKNKGSKAKLKKGQKNGSEDPPLQRIRYKCSVAAAATAPAAASAAAGLRGEGFAGAAGYRGTKDGELDRGLFAGAFRAGDFLLFVDYDFFEFVLAVFADVFVDGHDLLRLGALGFLSSR